MNDLSSAARDARRQRLRWLRPAPAVGVIAIVSLMVASCATPAAQPAPAFSTAELDTYGLPATSATPRDGGTLTVGWEQEPPCLVNNWVQVGYLSRQYLDNLVGAGYHGTVVPWLATSWNITDGGTTYTFDIKPGVKFTDGTPLTARAVSDNFHDWFDNADSPTYNGYLASHFGSNLQSWAAIGPLTFQVHLKAPDVYFLSALSLYPAGIQSPAAVARGAAVNCEHPVGTGPFEVVEWNRGQDVVLKRNPNYDSPPANAVNKGPAHLSTVDWKFVSNDETRWAALETGESDVIYNVPATDWAAALKKYQIEQYITPGTPNRFLLATRWGPLTDVRVRRAFAYAFDGPTAVQAVYQGEVRFNGNGTEATSTPGYDRALNNPFPYNPALADKLLDEAGWTARDSRGYRTKNGRRLTLRLVYAEDVNATTDDVDLYQVLQAQEKKVGIDVALTPLSASTYWQGGSTQPDRTWDLQQWYDVDRDSDTLVVDAAEGATEGVIASSAPEIKGLTARLSRTTDAAERDRISARIQHIIVQRDVAVLGTVPLPVTLAINPKVHGLWLEPDVGEPVLSDAYFAR